MDWSGAVAALVDRDHAVRDEVPVSEQAGNDSAFARVVTELRQWHVFRFAATFAVIAWLLVQVVATVGPAFDLPA